MGDSKSCIGCGIGCAVLLFGLPIAFGVFNISKIETKNFFERRRERQAEEDKKIEQQKAQQAEAARLAEAKRRQEAEAAEAKRRQEAEAAEVERRRQAKESKIQTFALKEAPKLWSVHQALKSEIDVQNGKIEELRETLVMFGKSPEQDEDFKHICAMRDEMVRSQKAMYAKLEDAYIAACKFAATPSRKDYQEMHRKALEDGIREAAAAETRFREMRGHK